MRFLTALLAVVIGFAAGAWTAYSTPAPFDEPPAIRREPVGAIRQVAPHLYLVPGGGANSLVFVTNRGVVLVETKYQERWPEFLAQIQTVTDKPVIHVINTHRHPDHAEGNSRLAPGVAVSPQSLTVKQTLFDGEDAIDLYHFGPAHTDADVFVVFRSARVMHAGDVMARKSAPVIVIKGGGNGATFSGVVERAVKEIPDVDQVVTGHGPVVSWQEFADFAELNRLMFDHVKANMRMGADKWKVFKSFKAPEKYKDYDLSRAHITMDEIDASIRPWWQRVR